MVGIDLTANPFPSFPGPSIQIQGFPGFSVVGDVYRDDGGIGGIPSGGDLVIRAFDEQVSG